MAASISQFLSTFTTDVARTNRFDVYITPPILMIPYVVASTSSGNAYGRLMYRCENAQLPGKTIATTEQKIYGPIEKYPYLTTYNDLDLTFIVSDDMGEKVFFDTWMNYVNPALTNNLRYKGDYATDIVINQYDVTNNLTYSVQLIDAYPISVNQLDLDWSNDGYHKLNVTFAYTRWDPANTNLNPAELIDFGN
jgi:hypothetical protein